MSASSNSPNFSPCQSSSGSRPTSITRSSRENFVSELELLPPENVDVLHFELNEELLDIEELGEDNGSEDLLVGQESVNETQNSEQCDSRPDSKDSAKSDADDVIDSKIRKGLARIKKLDKILLQKCEHEKEVKLDRRRIEKEFQMQVQSLIKEKGAEKICGSQQLLSLCSSTDRNESSEHTEPIFSTQLNFEYYEEDNRKENLSKKATHSERSHSATTDEKKPKKNKDFIKRNIQLAAQASEVIALTDEERKQLDELLADDTDLLLIDNPFTVPSISTDGYMFSSEEKNVLAEIDAKLKELVPAEECTFSILDNSTVGDTKSVKESESSLTPRSISLDLVDPSDVACGEKVLQMEHNDRTIAQRLKNIEEQLKQLHHMEEDEYGAPIEPDLLRRLLDVDSRLTSSSTSICETIWSQLLSEIDLNSITSESVNNVDTDRSQEEVTVP